MQAILWAEHDVLRAKAREYLALLDRPLPPDMGVLSRKRMEFAGSFRNHIATERRYIATCLVGAKEPVRRLMEDFGRAFNQFYFDYSRHLHEWQLDRIRADWRGYAAASRSLYRRFSCLLDREEAEILPALAATAP